MPSVTLENRTLHFEDVGEGTPVLLLHGFPLSSESFWPQLERPPRGARLIVPDHQGFGRSPPGDEPFTMEQLALDALRLLDAMHLGSVVVGGVSMGGYASMALARLDPSRARALVLIDTQHGADDDAAQARREATALEVEAKGAAVVAEAMLPKLFAPSVLPATRERIDRIMRAQRPASIAAASRGMARRRDSGDVLAHHAGPCLIVVGAQDTLTPPAKARAMAERMKDAELEVIDGAGHLSNLEQPDAFNAAVERLLRRLP